MNTQRNQSLDERFPEMRPMGNVPTMFRINGCGLALYGNRDYDQETGTYVKTYCLCFLFIPLIAFRAYRVADAEQGWYFIGIEPMSRFARTWNKIFAMLVVFLALQIGWAGYTSTESYKTSKDLRTAAKQLEAHEPLRAATTYRSRLGGKAHQDKVRAGLKTSLEQCLASSSAKTWEGTYWLIGGLSSSDRNAFVPDAFKRGLSHVEKLRASDPEGALDLLDPVTKLEPKNASVPELKIALLKDAIAAKPNNTNRVVELALIYEESEQLTNAQTLLLPYKAKLGASEGARILGQALLRENQNEDAYQLLYPYVQTRLQRLRAIERTYTNAAAAASARAISDLEHNRAGELFYSRYRSASKDEQRDMVNSYIRDAMQRDGTYKRALAELQASSKIVHVTLDLGIVQLNRAQALQDSAARRAELEAAEKTFLAIGGLAGDTDEYKLFLGQVYYWLGKSAQGKELFDKLLADRKRSYHLLVTLGEIVRKVGEHDEARALFEEAYRKAPREDLRYHAATARAHVQRNNDDQIAWFRKADPKDVVIQISLAASLGRKALEDGDNASAAIHLRKAIDGYESLPRDTAAAYNNCGLAYLDLYRAIGNVADHEKGLRLLEGAVDFDPSNSILLKNTLRMLYHAAINDVLRGRLNLESIGESGDLRSLSFLYDNESERDAVYDALFANPKMKKAIAYLDKALLLSPKETHLYSLSAHLHGSLRNVPELQRLQQRFAAAQIDPGHAAAEGAELLSGTRDKEYLAQINGSIARLEAALLKPSVQRDTRLQDYIHCQLVNLSQGRAMYGVRVDTAKDLERARVAYERSPSAGARNTYAFMLAYRAHEQLAAGDENYARLARKTQRALNAPYLLSLVVEHNDATAAMLRTNAYFAKAAELYRDGAERFPNHPLAFEWAFLKPLFPQTADAVAQHLAKDEGERISRELELSIRPLDANANLEKYWCAKSAGDIASANVTYQKAIKAGLPLPEL